MGTFLLIPGAGDTSWYWHRLAPHLERERHAVIAVDLPAGDDRAGLQEYADVVVAAAATKDWDHLVVVAQSMGGLTAPLVCSRLPVERLVLLNAMVPTPGESGNEWWVNTGQDAARRELDSHEGRSPDAPFDPLIYFFHDVPDDITRVAMTGVRRSRQRPSRSLGHWMPGPKCPPSRSAAGRTAASRSSSEGAWRRNGWVSRR